MTKYYAGIGSRNTPTNICQLFTGLAVTLAHMGFILRSGAADGADAAFERGADQKKEIYLPWRRFNGHFSPLYTISQEVLDMAAQHHPAWGLCSQGAQKLHARNCHQVLGQDLKTPVSFVVCWTHGGAGEGGTGQALRIARAHDIPIFDFGHHPKTVMKNLEILLAGSRS